MKVEFQNNFIVPGFGRKRFMAGICLDVPDALRSVLPISATILPDDFVEHDKQPHEDAAATRYAEEQAKAARTRDAMNASGMDGWADENDPLVGPQPTADPEPVEVWEFEGQVYKTEPAMKAAMTRSQKKGSM